MEEKVKLVVPEEITVGEDFTARIEKIEKQIRLMQARQQPEVFLWMNKISGGYWFEDGKKHWIENPTTFIKLGEIFGFTWIDIAERGLTLNEINELKTGGTILLKNGVFIVGTRAKDIYFPPEPGPINQLKEMEGKIILLTLNPKPNNAQIVRDLGFNGLMPYADIVSGWNGDLISIPDRPGVIIRFTADEPDCRKHDPYKELELYKWMKKETPNIPVGFVLCQAIGCGLTYTIDGKTITKEDWAEVAKQVDYIACGVYTWHEKFTDPNDIDGSALKALKSQADQIDIAIGGVPFIPILQAHWGMTSSNGHKVLKPNIELEVKFWVERGYKGYIVYCWSDEYHGVRDMQDEWKKWNKWALSQF